MPGEAVVSVRGEAVLEAEPEIAVVDVTVMARDKSRRRAVDLLTARNGAVTALIKGYGDAVEKLESGPVSVHPEFREARPRERVTGYVARSGLRATIRDFTALGELVPGLANEEMVAVEGPEWRLRRNSPVYREARLAAAKDALQRAREYAEAFGGEITGLVEAADEGLVRDQVRHRGLMAGGRAPARLGPEEDLGFDFEPTRQTVHAQVEARFTMTSPSLGG